MVGPLIGVEAAVPDWMSEGEFELRPLRESDRDEVFAITAQTWSDAATCASKSCNVREP